MITLFILSVIDIKTHYVPPLGQLCLIISLLVFQVSSFQFWPGLIITIILSLIYLKKHQVIGGGDIKVLMILSFFYSGYFSLILLIASLLAMIYLKISQKQIIPFIPFITIGVYYVELTNYV